MICATPPDCAFNWLVVELYQTVPLAGPDGSEDCPVNTSGAEKLYELAVGFLGPLQTDSVLDLYCGTGTIGIVIAPFVKQVTGVEQSEAAVKDAEKNKLRNSISNMSFEAGSVEKWIKHAEK